MTDEVGLGPTQKPRLDGARLLSLKLDPIKANWTCSRTILKIVIFFLENENSFLQIIFLKIISRFV